MPNGQEWLREAAKHGFHCAIVPRANAPKGGMEGIEVVPIDRLSDVLGLI